ncbi:MAG: glycogen debranching enzyme, partial [Verrucomicrobiales bacterium]
FATLICSQGVPFLLAGDERLRSQSGNNNGYCQDNEISWISWNDTPDGTAMYQFVRKLLQLRRDHPVLRRNAFFNGRALDESGLPDICWLRPDGKVKESIDWEAEKAGSFSVLIHGSERERSLLFIFNARQETREFHFPNEPKSSWELVIDTSESSLNGTRAGYSETVFVVQRSMQIWKQSLK